MYQSVAAIQDDKSLVHTCRQAHPNSDTSTPSCDLVHTSITIVTAKPIDAIHLIAIKELSTVVHGRGLVSWQMVFHCKESVRLFLLYHLAVARSACLSSGSQSLPCYTPSYYLDSSQFSHLLGAATIRKG
eukprot:1056704-Amphidinium_carterae.1